jgi:AraC-like DNA-binding protein
MKYSKCEKPSWLRKGLPSAIDVFLEESCPQLGGDLTREPVVKKIIELVDEYLPSSERMRQGQVLWYAVDVDETSGYGKKIEKCKTKPVIVDLFTESDIDDLMKKIPKKDRMQKIAVRLFEESYEQNGVFTLNDVAAILKLSEGTISKYVREYEKTKNEVVPRRGNIHDMGPTLTHKKIICYKYYKEGKTVEDVCRETRHSKESVARYIDAFARVKECLKENWSIERISQVTALSRGLTKQYVDLIQSEKIQFDKNEIPR